MSDNTMESGQEQANQELPIPKFENASVASPTSSPDTDALAETILKKLEPILDRKLQSTKDKRIADIEKKLSSGRFAELEEMGAQIPENVKLEYRLRELEQRTAPSQVASPSQGSGGQLTAQDVTEIVTSFGLDANSADVIEMLRGSYRNRDHFESTMARLAIKKTKNPTPSPSATIAGNAPVSLGKTDSQLEADYIKDMRAARGKADTVRKIKEEYLKKGVNIYGIDLT